MKGQRLLRLDLLMPGLMSRQDVPQVALVLGSAIRQAKRHANIAVRGALAPAHLGRPEELLRCDSGETWDVDADS
jgi:hypothetical protein